MTTTMMSGPTVSSFAWFAATTAMMMSEMPITDTSGSTLAHVAATFSKK